MTRWLAQQLRRISGHRMNPATPALDAEGHGIPSGTQPAAGGDLAALLALCATTAEQMLPLITDMRAAIDAGLAQGADPVAPLHQVDENRCQLKALVERMSLLAGHPPADPDRQPTTIADVIDVARCRTSGWRRISAGTVPHIAVAERCAADLIRAATELMRNSVQYSAAAVTVSAHWIWDSATGSNGILIRVEDSGTGMDPHIIATINQWLAGPDAPVPVLALPRTDGGGRGFAVTRRATRPHGMRALLVARLPHGITAQIYVPAPLLCEPPSTGGEMPGHLPPAASRGAAAGARQQPQALTAQPAAADDRPLPTRLPQRPGERYPASVTPLPSAPRQASGPIDPTGAFGFDSSANAEATSPYHRHVDRETRS